MRQAKPYSRLPSEYWRTNCYAGISPFNSNYPSVGDLGTAGQDPEEFAVRSTNAMMGADYPHPETAFPGLLHEVKAFVEHPNVTEDDARRVLFGNAAELYQLDLDALRPHIDRVGFDLDDIPVPEGVAGLDMTVLADLAARNEAEAHSPAAATMGLSTETSWDPSRPPMTGAIGMSRVRRPTTTTGWGGVTTAHLRRRQLPLDRWKGPGIPPFEAAWKRTLNSCAKMPPRA